MNIDRIERALEGMLSAEEMEAFKAEVCQDGALRTAYVERLWLHSTLRAEGASLRAFLEPAPVERMRRPWLAWGGWAALAAVLAVAATFAFTRVRPVATLVQAENCRWSGSELPTAVNSRLGPGKLALVEGMATLRFHNGATVTIEAPTKFQILDGWHCRLLEGSAVAEVPPPAHGFAIETADLKVIDLGTKFGVTAGSTGHTQVRVFAGQVDVSGLPGGQLKRLTEGKGLQAGSGALPAGQEPVRGQQVREGEGWTAIPTSFGRGQDSFVRRGDGQGPSGALPLLMVKHSDLPASRDNERRAALTFDLTGVEATNVSEAQLILDPQPSGYGFSTLVPDSRFALYGVLDDTAPWSEKTLLWNDLPGCNDGGAIEWKTRKLAEFWIPRGGTGGQITVRGEALAAFLRERTRGLATFLILRETGETDPTGLVHAFASKEHPTGRPPTLRIR